MKNGQMILFVGPTCVGKTTLIEALCEQLPDAGVIISTTTRPIRPNETNGVDYEFTTNEDFLRRKESGEFYEAVLRPTGYYGSSKVLLGELLKKHPLVFGALDIEGCRMVKKLEPSTFIIFLYPGDMNDLRRRLELRGTNSDEMMTRLRIAQDEMLARDDFDAAIKNIDGKFENTVSEVLSLIENLRVGRKK